MKLSKKLLALAVASAGLLIITGCGFFGGEKGKDAESTPVPTARPVDFSDPNVILSVFASEGNDKSFSPFSAYETLHGPQVQERIFPRVIPMLKHADGTLFSKSESPAETRGIVFGQYVITAYDWRGISVPRALIDEGVLGALVLSFSEGSTTTGEILGEAVFSDFERCVGSKKYECIEIYKRNENSSYPYPEILPFEIEEFSELSSDPSDALVYYGYTQGIKGRYGLTEKRGFISSLDESARLIKMKGTVAGRDPGAPVFVIRCGKPKLAGIVFGSLENKGRETEAFVLGIEKVMEIFERETGEKLIFKPSTPDCPQLNSASRDQFIKNLSDGSYDYSYDLSDVKELNFSKFRDTIRPFENVISITDANGPRDKAISMGSALVLGRHVAVASSAMTISPLYEGHKHRIVWEKISDGERTIEYEYLEFLGYDKSGRVGIFLRTDPVRISESKETELVSGNSRELQVGAKASVLYSVGSYNFGPTGDIDSAMVSDSTGPLVVISAQDDNESFYFQGSFSPNESGSAVFAMRDGEPELVGFIEGNISSSDSETLGVAMSAELMIEALNEHGCADKLCQNPSASLGQVNPNDEKVLQSRIKIGVVYPAKDIHENYSMSVVYAEGVWLNEEYMVTSAEPFLVRRLVFSNKGFAEEVIDVSAEDSDPKQSLVGVVLVREVFPDYQVSDFAEGKLEGEEGVSMEMLEVVEVYQDSGFALLKRINPSGGNHSDIGDFSVTDEEKMRSGMEIMAVHSQVIVHQSGGPKYADLITHGTTVYAEPGLSEFIFNGYATKENLGAPIFSKDGKEIVGIISRPYENYSNRVDTEGFGVTMEFILKKIKDSGIDISLLR